MSTVAQQKENVQAFEEGLKKQRLQKAEVLHERESKGDTLTVKERKKLDKWKLTPDGIFHSARLHIGNILNNTTGTGIKDLGDAILVGALAYQSYNVLNGKDNGWTTALYGPIALKLATTPGSGIVPASQAVGLAMLGVLGLVSVPGIERPLLSYLVPGYDFNKSVEATYKALTAFFGNFVFTP
jgi:hypothetical protein